MFQLLAEVMTAWNQIGFLIGAALFAGIGLLLLGNRVYWRIRATRHIATIIGVRQSDARSCYPVYQYVSPTGETIEATSNIGTSSTRGMETGREVQILVLEGDPHKAFEPGNYMLEVVATLFATMGLGLGYIAFTAWPITRVTWIVLAVAMIFFAHRASTRWHRTSQRPTLAAWKEQRRLQVEQAPIRRAEEIADPTVVRQQKISPRLAPVFLAIAALMLGLSLFLGNRLYQLQASGRRAPGTVTSLEQSGGSDGHYTYHAVVSFRTDETGQVEFKDSFGSNPPTLHVDDPVTVLYLPQSPQKSAIVDRHAWNWVPSLALMLMGAIFAYAGSRLRRSPLAVRAGAVSSAAS